MAGGVFVASSPDSSFFYLFTAAHAIYLVGGVAGLAHIAFRPLRRLTLGSAVAVGAMYWHFLTVIWLVILTLVLGGSR
jgi:cytochrome c oxidase subunit 3